MTEENTHPLQAIGDVERRDNRTLNNEEQLTAINQMNMTTLLRNNVTESTPAH